MLSVFSNFPISLLLTINLVFYLLLNNDESFSGMSIATSVYICVFILIMIATIAITITRAFKDSQRIILLGSNIPSTNTSTEDFSTFKACDDIVINKFTIFKWSCVSITIVCIILSIIASTLFTAGHLTNEKSLCFAGVYILAPAFLFQIISSIINLINIIAWENYYKTTMISYNEDRLALASANNETASTTIVLDNVTSSLNDAISR